MNVLRCPKRTQATKLTNQEGSPDYQHVTCRACSDRMGVFPQSLSIFIFFESGSLPELAAHCYACAGLPISVVDPSVFTLHPGSCLSWPLLSQFLQATTRKDRHGSVSYLNSVSCLSDKHQAWKRL